MVLGVASVAPFEDIRLAYKKLVMQTHPALVGGDGARYRRLERAFEQAKREREAPDHE